MNPVDDYLDDLFSLPVMAAAVVCTLGLVFVIGLLLIQVLPV